MKDLIDKFNNLDNDIKKWEFVVANKDSGIIVKLDNDDTYIEYYDEAKDETHVGIFDSYIGWSDGVLMLLEAFGINCELV